MRAVCISSSYCQYKTDTGYCGYTGMGCSQGLVRSAKMPEDYAAFTLVRQVELTDENINKIAEAVVEKLRNCGAKMEPISASPENGQEVEA